jgi:hypothetical protein
MAIINTHNNVKFKSSKFLISKIKRDLASLVSVNLIDENDFYSHIKEVINELGIAYYQECESIIPIKDYKGKLPDDFNLLYSAYKCKPSYNHHNKPIPQNGFVFRTTTCEDIEKTKCGIEFKGEKITVRDYVNPMPIIYEFHKPTLLHLSNNVKKNRCSDDCLNINVYSNNQNEINIDGDYIYTNFEENVIYIKYYSFPFDEESGIPLIPDVSSVERAIEDKIKWRVIEQLYLDGAIPDGDKKLSYLLQMSEVSLEKAKYEVKLWSFGSSVDGIRIIRNRFNIYKI